MKKKNEHRILSGVVVLTVSNLVVKLLGLFFKIPLHSFLGDQGMSYFNIAYNIFITLYMVSTAGLPIAISILVSKSRTKGRKREVRRIFGVALLVFLIMGMAGSSLMLFGAEPLSSLMGSENARYCIISIAPTLLFICLSSAMRGYFQGHQNMVPTAVSEIIESIGKFAIGISLAHFAIERGKSIEIAAAYAIGGISIGVVLGTVFLTTAKLFSRQDSLYPDITDETADSRKQILSAMFSIAVPITVSAVALNLTGIIDSVTIINRMSLYTTQDAAETAYGNYSTLAVTLTHLPSAFITPIASALTPALASMIEKGRVEKSHSVMTASLKFAAVISIPCAIGMSVLSKPILNLLFNTDGSKTQSVASAAPLLSVLAISVFFTAMLTITNSILQTHRLERKPILSMLCGAAVKLVINYILIAIPEIGIYGAPIGTLVSYFVMASMNFYFVARYVRLDVKVIKTFIRPFAATVLASLFTVSSYIGLEKAIGAGGATVLSILITVFVYLILLFATKTIKKEEILVLPFGKKLNDVLSKIKFIS